MWRHRYSRAWRDGDFRRSAVQETVVALPTPRVHGGPWSRDPSCARRGGWARFWGAWRGWFFVLAGRNTWRFAVNLLRGGVSDTAVGSRCPGSPGAPPLPRAT